jgi:hypothetical protein
MLAKHITDLTVENFRGLERLELHGLQSVNLIVGQNNVGKTSLLEAVLLSCDSRQADQLPGMLHGRVRNNPRDHGQESDPMFSRWVIRDGDNSHEAKLMASGEDFRATVLLQKEELRHQVPPVGMSHDDLCHQSEGLRIWRKKAPAFLRVRVVSSLPSSGSAMVITVGNALRKRQGEELIHKILKKIDPRIQRVRVDPTPQGNIVALDIGLSEMIPITQAGQGAVRLVTMLSELIGENAQVCIIDEIENGIHHTALKDVWRGVAEISSVMGVQVFSTTHSAECLAAANEVFFSEDTTQQNDFALIQLMRVKDQVAGKVLSEKRVNDALENEIELR